MWKKVISLTKVFLKDTYSKLKIFNTQNKKIDKKSIFFWMMVIIVTFVAFLSYKVIDFLVHAGQPELFLNFYMLILTIILMFQIILIATNVLFFSKELEFVLPMPISSTELLLSKFGVFLVTVYMGELLFGFIPLTIYGTMTHISILYFIIMPILLILYPILLVSIISLITIVLMKFSKFIKNKNIYQTVITIVLLIIVFTFEGIAMNRIKVNNIEDSSEGVQIYEHIGDGFLIINPAVKLLSKPNDITNIISNFGIFIIYDFISIFLFLLLGNRVYIRNILLGTMNRLNSKNKKIKIKKKNTIVKAYILKEFKQLYRNPAFFMQLVFPVLLLIISVIIMGGAILPIIQNTIQNNEELKTSLEQLTINSEVTFFIFAALQVLFSMSALSLTAISREGNNAITMKYIPISTYRQFLYKNILQVIFNVIISASVLTFIYFLFGKFSILQIVIIFITSIFISLINSYTMLIVDIKKPMLNWDSEYILLKKNSNKIFQYVFLIIMILVLLYFSNIMKDINLEKALLIQLLIFVIIYIGMDIWVRKHSKNLLKNIK